MVHVTSLSPNLLLNWENRFSLGKYTMIQMSIVGGFCHKDVPKNPTLIGCILQGI
jgi:hypothetical protein